MIRAGDCGKGRIEPAYVKSGLAAFFFVLMLIAVAFLANPPPPPPPDLRGFVFFLFIDRAVSPLMLEKEEEGLMKPLVVDESAIIAPSVGRWSANFIMVVGACCVRRLCCLCR